GALLRRARTHPVPGRARPLIPWLQLAALAASAMPRTALVVGANQGLAGDEPLQFAESDAEGVAKAFSETGLVPPIGIRILADPPASDLRAALRAVIAAAPSELFLFYVSSHGDADGLHLNGGTLSWAELTDLLSRIPTRRVLAFVDACRSGAMLTAKGIVRGPPLELSVNALGPRGRALITSSGSSEASYESVWLQGSPFSKLLVSGLRGAADLDRDGRVTLDELYRFLFDHVAAATVAAPAGPQHAHAELELAGAGDWVITETGARATLRRT